MRERGEVKSGTRFLALATGRKELLRIGRIGKADLISNHQQHLSFYNRRLKKKDNVSEAHDSRIF